MLPSAWITTSRTSLCDDLHGRFGRDRGGLAFHSKDTSDFLLCGNDHDISACWGRRGYLMNGMVHLKSWRADGKDGRSLRRPS